MPIRILPYNPNALLLSLSRSVLSLHELSHCHIPSPSPIHSYIQIYPSLARALSSD